MGRNRRDDTGWDVSQSGFYDDHILCFDHEAQLGRFDDYASRFCRAFRTQTAKGESLVEVRNERPELLVGFACAVVWRMAASRSKPDLKDMLGGFAQPLQAFLFDGVPFSPLLLLSRNAFQIKGTLLDMNVLPAPFKELDRRFRRFITCGIIFDLYIDDRPVPDMMVPLAANKRRKITLVEDFPQDALRTPGLAEALMRFTLPKGPHRPDER